MTYVQAAGSRHEYNSSCVMDIDKEEKEEKCSFLKDHWKKQFLVQSIAAII